MAKLAAPSCLLTCFRACFWASLLAAGCGDRTGLGVSSAVESADSGGTSTGRGVQDCVKAGVTYIYVIGEDGELYSFDPMTGSFTALGPIVCPTTFSTASPFSMAVDHTGVAYVVFDDGELFRVSTKTAACTATSYVPNQLGFGTFGMGFVANAVDGGETLYISGDNDPTSGIPGPLGAIDLPSFNVRRIAPFSAPLYRSELTGTGGGKLFAFYATDNMAGPSFIAEVDPTTAEVVDNITLPGVIEGQGWAFGFWGGDFYTFTAPDAVTSVVTRYRPSDKSTVQVATAPPGVIVVGAGVSTCAPQQ